MIQEQTKQNIANAKYSNITFVIPSISSNTPTIESIPITSSYIIRGDDTRGKARNEGAKWCKTEYLVFADSDIDFTDLFLDYALSLVDDKTIVGLQGYWPSPFIISRFMIMKKAIFDDVGYLKEVQHGEETEWCIRAIEKGYKLIGVPRESVYHHPHEKSEHKKEWKNLVWLIKLHPEFPLMMIKNFMNKMKYSDYGDD